LREESGLMGFHIYMTGVKNPFGYFEVLSKDGIVLAWKLSTMTQKVRISMKEPGCG